MFKAESSATETTYDAQRNRITQVTRAGMALTAIFLVFVPWNYLGGQASTSGHSMPMTHYMELLATNQPWNLLFFMAMPVILAETLAITELAILLDKAPRWVRLSNRWAGLLGGPVMVAIAVYVIVNAVVPLTNLGGWRGPADVIAVFAYLLSGIPLIMITLQELHFFHHNKHQQRVLHAACVGAFLILAHIAMIFGMLDPGVFGNNNTNHPSPPAVSSDPSMTPGIHSSHSK